MKENEKKYKEAANIFKALANENRLYILKGLSDENCNVKKITKCLGMPQSTVSQYLRTLKEAGIIEGERQGNEVCYSITNDKIIDIIDSLTK